MSKWRIWNDSENGKSIKEKKTKGGNQTQKKP